ncbi:LacI family transcriptional regulator [Jeotgalibacillus sp. S-D1]|uniref:LacI family DNA-binding transcriptional regulator n=1 Tax=Jeotgalibacillus sp. S-D1 TaxID=2552189 RepID=UPI00105A9CF7|nr:LacI family DNA-binding transcriptional regulator [Jeotgalibacillus sp. S-D1]TDL34265.1 LacI family transcriptional regulator [Jeotgalibacillus sp. S-D1]
MGVTIKDVAKAAGVSYSTVSKALRDSPLVKEPTKKHITEIASKLGYQPNAAARSLVSKKSHTIGIVWPTIERVAHASLITSMNKQLEQLSYTSLISINEMEFAVNVFNRYQVDAILVFNDGCSEQNHASTVPLVTYGIAHSATVSPTVDVQRKKAIFLAAEYLQSIGHRKISYIGAIDEEDCMQLEKEKGFKLAINQLGLETYEDQVIHVSGLEQYDGYSAAKELLSKPGKPTAIISASHDLTKGILRALHEQNLSVPADLSLISYDNIPESYDLDVPISTVGVPLEKITEKLADVLMDVIDNSISENVIYLEPELQVSKSCKPI